MFTVGAKVTSADVSDETQTRTSDEAKDENSGRDNASSTDLTQTLTCHKTPTTTATAAADGVLITDQVTHNKPKTSHSFQNAEDSKGNGNNDSKDDKDDDDDDKNDKAADEDYTDDDDDNEQVYTMQ